MKPKSNDLRPKHKIAVVIRADDGSSAEIKNTLDSILRQTLQKSHFGVLIACLDLELAEFNQALTATADERYADINLKHISLPAGHTILEAKISAAEQANSSLIMFLSPGDTLDKDYLKKAALALEAAPKRAWVYSNLIKSVPYKVIVNSPPFSPYRLLFSKDLIFDGVFRTHDWLKAAKKAQKNDKHPLYNDTLAICLHLMKTGGFGIPMKDTNLYSNRPVFLSSKKFLLSQYITFRLNIFCLFFLFKSRSADQAHIKRGHGYRSKIHPMYWVERWQQKINAKYLGNSGVKAVISLKMMLRSLILPNSFVKKFLNPEETISLADIICGFVRKPVNISASISPNHALTPVILVAQTNWMIGGAEKVLLDWVESAREIEDCKIIDLCERDRFGEFNNAVKDQFSKLVDEQYNLDRLAATPLQRKKICWNLISTEQPKIIFISGNAFLYSLLPDIKKYLPNVFVADILHNEWDIPGDWFDVSYEYKDYIDNRITTSEYWAGRMTDSYGEKADKVKVFLNSIRTDKFDSKLFPKNDLQVQINIPEDKFIVGFIGRLHYQKNPGVFYELARMCRYNSHHFIVVGDGEEREKLISRYSNLNNLSYFGAANDVRPFIAVCDVIVFCSTYEGFPMMSLEAAAMNTPIIAPNIVGFREQIDIGQFGLLYPSTDNKAEDAETIYKILIERKAELMALGGNGREYINQFHAHELLSSPRTEFFKHALTRIQSSQPSGGRVIRKRKRVYLHIGMHKTGTTSIQHFAYINRTNLSLKGLIYPTKRLHGKAHHVLAQNFSVNKNIFGLNHEQKIQTPFELERYRQSLLSARENKILLSSEGFLFADVNELFSFLSDFDVTVIFFVRRQDHWLESTYNQNLKMGSFIVQSGEQTLTPEQHYKKTSGQMDYLKHARRWAAAFGKENITVVPFEKETFPEGLEKYFCQLLGIPYGSSLITPERLNPSLDQSCLVYLATKRLDNRMGKRQFNELIKLLEQYSLTNISRSKKGHVYSPAFRRKLIEKYAESNRRLALNYIQNEDGVLFKEALPDHNESWIPFKLIADEQIDQIDRYLISKGVSSEQLRAGSAHR